MNLSLNQTTQKLRCNLVGYFKVTWNKGDLIY